MKKRTKQKIEDQGQETFRPVFMPIYPYLSHAFPPGIPILNKNQAYRQGIKESVSSDYPERRKDSGHNN